MAPAVFGILLLGGRLFAAYHWRAAHAALERHAFAPAQAHLKHCLRVRGDAETLFLAARTARRAHDYGEAARWLSACEKKQGTAPAILLEQLLTRVQQGQGTPDVEARLWSLLNQNHPDSLLIVEALAQGYIYTYQLPNAQFCLARWLEQQPNCVPALLWWAQICITQRKYEEALNAYQRAIALEPACDTARLQLADFLVHCGQADRAAEHYEHLWPRHTQDPELLLGLARCREAQGRTTEAGSLLDALLQQHPDAMSALRERGKLALESGRQAEAEAWLRKCLARDPYDHEATYLFALCLQQLGKSQEAQVYRLRLQRLDADLERLEVLNRALGVTTASASLRHEAGVICLRNGQEHEGLRWLTGALHVDPLYGPAHRTLAGYYQRAGQLDLADRHRRLASASRENTP